MSGDEVQVDPGDLQRKATQIESLTWPSQATQADPRAADGLMVASTAATYLRMNAEALSARQEYGRQEGQRLAQTLRNVADAYAQIDQMAGEDIGGTMDGPAAPSGPGATVFPEPVSLPAPTVPAEIPAGREAPDEAYLDVLQAESLLNSADDGNSLRTAAELWRGNGVALEASAQEFEVNSTLWEGEAADAAYAKFNAYRDWLISLAESWKNLAGEAERIATEHDKAQDAHRPIAEEYRSLQEQAMTQPPTTAMATFDKMQKLQVSSEEVRDSYASGATPNRVEPEDPPNPVLARMPVTAEDHRRARPNTADDGDERRPGTPGGQPGSGQPGAGGAPGSTPQEEAAVSPMSAAEQAGQGAPQGASQGGGSPGGGQGGSQGGSPGGTPGGAPSGMPGLGKGDPKLPTDPSLRPAASGGGGAGGGGAGGGGVPSSPLQPAVGPETVAPTPVASTGTPGAAAGSSGGGAVGGGMGGMAPMMGGARGGGESGDKKRNPQLSEDEEIYTEERPHTEPVIGYRPRRRGGSDDSKKESP